MSGQGDDRSIGMGARPEPPAAGGNGNQSIHVGGSVDRGVFVVGNSNQVRADMTQVQPPPEQQVDIAAEIAGLRALLEGLNTPERRKLSNAMDEAGDEAAKPSPRKGEVADALERAVKASKGAADFAENAVEIKERVVRIAGWLGPLAKGALALLGLSTF